MNQPSNPGNMGIPVGGADVGGRQAGSAFAESPYTPGANSTVVATQVIEIRPNEVVAALAEIDLRVLLDGDASGARADRDMYLGILSTALVGLIGLIAATWDDIFTKGQWGWAIWVAVMLLIVGGSGFGAAICETKRRKVSKNSAYSSLIGSLKKRLGIDQQ